MGGYEREVHVRTNMDGPKQLPEQLNEELLDEQPKNDAVDEETAESAYSINSEPSGFEEGHG